MFVGAITLFFLSKLEMLSLEWYDGPLSSEWWISSLTDLIYISRADSLLVGGVHLDFHLKFGNLVGS